MIDPNTLTQLVTQEIQNSIRKEIDTIVQQTDWIKELESQIVSRVQHNITSRLSDISTVPDLVKTVQQSVSQLFASGQVPGIADYVDNNDIQIGIKQAVDILVTNTVNELQNDPNWVKQIQDSINHLMVHSLREDLSKIDIKQEMSTIIFENKEVIGRIFKKDFSTLGIKDTSSHNQLTVMDGAVVVENELFANDMTIERTAEFKGDLIVSGDLALLGTINVDNASWNELSEHISDITFKKVQQDFEQGTLDKITQLAKEGIDITDVSVDGELLIQDGTLASTVHKSNITQLGELESLKVKNTLVASKGRLGINTQNPSDTFNLWDDEVSVSIGKHSDNTAYIGTEKNQDLVLGTNRQKRLTVGKNGGVWVDKLTVGTNNVSFEGSVPNYSGTKGDIVFNKNCGPGKPFAWICLGNFKWQELNAG